MCAGSRVITLFYSNDGLIPNHMMLWRPPTQWMFSFFFILSRPDEVAVGFALCGLIYLGLLVGWRTRLMQVLALIAVLSLHSRVTLLENGGDWMLGELALWTAFLPLGRRFSVDAVRASLRARRETTAAELARSQGDGRAGQPDTSCRWRCSRWRCEIANAYIFNAVHKGGQTWRTGTAVHYVMHQDRMCTWLAVWMRPHMTLWLSRIMSWGALATEAILPVMLLAPVQKVAGAAGRDRLHHRAARRLPAVHQPGDVLVRDDRLHAVLADRRGLGGVRALRAAAQAPADRVLRRRLRRLLPDRARCGRAWIGWGA